MEDKIFKNISGKIPLSELFSFKPDPELVPDTTRYFIIKRGLRTTVDPKTGLEVREYLGYVYSTGTHKDWKRPIDQPRCLDMFNWWRFSFDSSSHWRDVEMLEIDMTS